MSDENGNGLPNYDSIFGLPSYEEATKHITIDTNEVVRSRNFHTKKLFRKYLICLLIPLTIVIIVYFFYFYFYFWKNYTIFLGLKHKKVKPHLHSTFSEKLGQKTGKMGNVDHCCRPSFPFLDMAQKDANKWAGMPENG